MPSTEFQMVFIAVVSVSVYDTNVVVRSPLATCWVRAACDVGIRRQNVQRCCGAASGNVGLPEGAQGKLVTQAQLAPVPRIVQVIQ